LKDEFDDWFETNDAAEAPGEWGDVGGGGAGFFVLAAKSPAGARGRSRGFAGRVAGGY
jgi:hypothetical protein